MENADGLYELELNKKRERLKNQLMNEEFQYETEFVQYLNEQAEMDLKNRHNALLAKKSAREKEREEFVKKMKIQQKL